VDVDSVTHHRDPSSAFSSASTGRKPVLRILSLGAGVQSTALALMAAHGEIEPPDCAIFADTGWEPRAVYEHLDWLTSGNVLSFPVHRVSRGNLRDDAVAHAYGAKLAHGHRPQPPYHLRLASGDPGLAGRQCTRDYKIAAIEGEIRRQLGVAAGKRVPSGIGVTMLIGISMDEAHRMKPSDKAYVTNTWPLIDIGMSRGDCLGWLERHGYPRPPKSACIGCPYHSDEQWLSLAPAEFADAVAFEASIQGGSVGFPTATPYLHHSLVPLDQVDFSRRDPGRQPDLFGNECEGMCGV